jgi:glucosamine--fructose-6-phosphate aminotransferase (isomerizing)
MLANKIPGVLSGTAGIGHTRWATHGQPSEKNAHPHHDGTGKLWLVHNGIIENYAELKEDMLAKGSVFLSETDTEVLAHLIGYYYQEILDLPKAVVEALKQVQGTYGIAVMHEDLPTTIVTARMGSPIALGIKQGEYIIASDTTPMLRHTHDIIYLNDGEYAVVSPEGYGIYSFAQEQLKRTPLRVDVSMEEAKKDGYPHFMLKEILEVPTVLEHSARGRIVMKDGNARLGGLIDKEDMLRNAERILIVGCGSAYYAGMVGKLLIEKYADIPVEIELASEFRNRKILAQKNSVLLAVSQSGETADTLASIREAKRLGIPTMGVVNVIGSTIARETDVGVYNHAGPEMGVASTKAFLSQLEVLALIALNLGRMRGLSEARGAELAMEIKRLPDKVRSILKRRDEIKVLAEEYLGYDDFLYIGRNFNLATAYEGALKLKEVSYVHAEGYGAGEMKHGPIALIDEIFPTVANMPRDSVYDKMKSNVQEIKARNGRVLAIATESDAEIASLVDDVFYIPDTKESLTPILATVPLQLFAYYTGVLRGFNVDRPRNLAKSVTVE